MIISGIFGLIFSTTLSEEKVTVAKIKQKKEITDQYFLQYFSLFVLFAVPLDISYVNEFCIYILVLVFIGIVYIKCSLYYINPWLNILGYRFYDVEFETESGETRYAKIFSKEPLQKKSYKIKIANDNFAFVVNQKHKKTQGANSKL